MFPRYKDKITQSFPIPRKVRKFVLLNETFMPRIAPISPLAELQQNYRLLEQEYAYEKESYLQKSRDGGILPKIRQGLCWYPVQAGRNYYNSLNLPVIEIERDKNDDTEHNFEYGRPVCFFVSDASGRQRFLHFTATVNYAEDSRMIVVLPSSAVALSLQQSDNLGVQLYFDETTYKTMFTALSEVMQARGNRLAELRDALLGPSPLSFGSLFPGRFSWLNNRQEEAVNRVVAARDTAVVHGPPGTGKTTTLVEAVYETLHKENQVLVCAQSNMAVDWISEKLTDRGIRVLRIGNPTRVNDKMLAFTYERRFEAHPDYPELWKIRKMIREIAGQMRRQKIAGRKSHDDRLFRLRQRATELEIRIGRSLFDEARVVTCTLIGSAQRLLEGKRFGTLFIDEASQALEAACWSAIRKADRVIFAGDHCQLPPTIKCPEAARNGLSLTLMEKVVRRHPECVVLLHLQYRMHEAIMGFPSRWFYHNRLQAAPEVKYRSILELEEPLLWIDTAGEASGEEMSAETRSRSNKTEAESLIRHLREYIEKIGMNRMLDERIDFGLISPYKAQVYSIRNLLKNDRFFKPFRSLITVNTVDGFQGQERDIIFVSLVRTNETGNIGFLSDLRRMNVAITRARMKLVILGDSSTLSHHPFYRALYDYTIKAEWKKEAASPSD